ncbi:MAG: hypothetical protein DMD96_05195 [Candidatus Rokuibacteriota bacterium]|nr:MAG: hypothetical protein DMD96_05195 [Candidatus Rokubacteria bacterium]
MGRLTSEERHRIFVAQRQTAGEMMARLRAAPITAEHGAPRPRRLRLLTAAMIVMLLGGGWVADHPLELRLPASIVEALLPRVE